VLVWGFFCQVPHGVRCLISWWWARPLDVPFEPFRHGGPLAARAGAVELALCQFQKFEHSHLCWPSGDQLVGGVIRASVQILYLQAPGKTHGSAKTRPSIGKCPDGLAARSPFPGLDRASDRP
jgi:hypothetical protein